MAAQLPHRKPAAPLEPAHEWLWRAWHRLHPDRPMLPVGMGAPMPGPIPWRDVMAWADRHGYSEAEAELLDAAIQALDGIYLEHEAARRAKEAPPRANAPKRRH